MRCLIYVPQMAAFGGIERHVCTLARALSDRGHSVLIITTSNSLGDSLRSLLLDGNVALRELSAGRGQATLAAKGAWMVKEALYARLQNWSVIYTNGQSGLARCAWLAAGRHTRVVHHHHTAASDHEQRSWSPIFRSVLIRAPELVACSCATRDSLARVLGRDDVRYLPYLTPCPIARSLVEDRPYPAGVRLNFGYVGRLVAEKGIDSICSLSQRKDLTDITWHIYGSGPAYPREFFSQYPNIVYHGAFSGTEAHASALQQLDAVALFSVHNEGMPLSLIESMSAGLPWIATDQGGTREIAVNKENSIVISDPWDDARLAAAVREMASRLREGRTSRREQREAYDRTFNPETVLEKWCLFLEGEKPTEPVAAGAAA